MKVGVRIGVIDSDFCVYHSTKGKNAKQRKRHHRRWPSVEPLLVNWKPVNLLEQPDSLPASVPSRRQRDDRGDYSRYTLPIAVPHNE